MVDTTYFQQQREVLDFIDKLANPDLDPDEIKAIYTAEKNEISSLLQDREQMDEAAAVVLKRVNTQGVDTLPDESLHRLQRILFTALVIKEGKITESIEREEKQSRPNLGFTETINSVGKEAFRANSAKKESNARFIESLVNQFSTKLKLTPEQKVEFRRQFLQEQATLERMSHNRPLDPQVYVKKADAILTKIVPAEQYQKKKAEFIYPEEERTKHHAVQDQDQHLVDAIYTKDKGLQTLYQEVVLYDRQENFSRQLKNEVIKQQREVTVRPEKAFTVIPPFVAFEAAARILYKEDPTVPIEKAIPLSRAFMASQVFGGTESTPELVATIKTLVQEREGWLGTNMAADRLNDASNSPKFLREVQRRDLVNSLAAIVDDNKVMKQVFGELMDQPFVQEMARQIKQQASMQNPQGAGLSGLLSIAAAGSGVINDATSSISQSGGVVPYFPRTQGGQIDAPQSAGTIPSFTKYVSQQQNPALAFILTSERIATLKQDPDLFKRFTDVVHLASADTIHPQNAPQTFLALALLAADPYKPMDLKKLHTEFLKLPNLHKQGSANHEFLVFFESMMKLQEMAFVDGKPSARHAEFVQFAQQWVSRTYLSYLFSTYPEISLETLHVGLQAILNNPFMLGGDSLVGGISGSSATGIASGLASMGANMGVRMGIKNAIYSAGGIPGFLLGKAAEVIGGGLKSMGQRLLRGDFTGMFTNPQGGEWVVITIVAIVVFAILPLVIGSPSTLQEIVFSTTMAGGNLDGGANSQYIQVTKTANKNSFPDNNAGDVTYTIVIRAVGADLTEIRATDVFSVFAKNSAAPITPPALSGVPTSLTNGQSSPPITITVNLSQYKDAIVGNTVTVDAIANGKLHTSAASENVTIGTPPTGCFVFGAGWSAKDKSAELQAIARMQAEQPLYMTRLCAGGGIALDRGGPSSYGGFSRSGRNIIINDYVSKDGINIGIGGPENVFYTLTHESGHVFMRGQPLIYQHFKDRVTNIVPCTYGYLSGINSSESFAETIALYFHVPSWKGCMSGTTFSAKYPQLWGFADSDIFK